MSPPKDSSYQEKTPPPTPSRYNLRTRTPIAKNKSFRSRSKSLSVAPPISPNQSSSRTGTRSTTRKSIASARPARRTLPKRKARPSDVKLTVDRTLFQSHQSRQKATTSEAPRQSTHTESASYSAAEFEQTVGTLYDWKKTQLMDECRKHSLSTCGTKTQLRDRLSTFLAEEHGRLMESGHLIPQGATHDSTEHLPQIAGKEENEAENTVEANKIEDTPMKTRSGTVLNKNTATKSRKIKSGKENNDDCNTSNLSKGKQPNFSDAEPNLDDTETKKLSDTSDKTETKNFTTSTPQADVKPKPLQIDNNSNLQPSRDTGNDKNVQINSSSSPAMNHEQKHSLTEKQKPLQSYLISIAHEGDHAKNAKDGMIEREVKNIVHDEDTQMPDAHRDSHQVPKSVLSSPESSIKKVPLFFPEEKTANNDIQSLQAAKSSNSNDQQVEPSQENKDKSESGLAHNLALNQKISTSDHKPLAAEQIETKQNLNDKTVPTASTNNVSSEEPENVAIQMETEEYEQHEKKHEKHDTVEKENPIETVIEKTLSANEKESGTAELNTLIMVDRMTTGKAEKTEESIDSLEQDEPLGTEREEPKTDPSEYHQNSSPTPVEAEDDEESKRNSSPFSRFFRRANDRSPSERVQTSSPSEPVGNLLPASIDSKPTESRERSLEISKDDTSFPVDHGLPPSPSKPENQGETYIRLIDNNVAFRITNQAEEITFSESPLPSPRMKIIEPVVITEGEGKKTELETIGHEDPPENRLTTAPQDNVTPDKDDEQSLPIAFAPQTNVDDAMALDSDHGGQSSPQVTGTQESDGNQRYLVSDGDQERSDRVLDSSVVEIDSSANGDDTDDVARSADVDERSSEGERQSPLPARANHSREENLNQNNEIGLQVDSQGEAEDSLSSSDSRSLVDSPLRTTGIQNQADNSDRSGESPEPAHSSGISCLADRPDDDVAQQDQGRSFMPGAQAAQIDGDRDDDLYADEEEDIIEVEPRGGDVAITPDESEMEISDREESEIQARTLPQNETERRNEWVRTSPVCLVSGESSENSVDEDAPAQDKSDENRPKQSQIQNSPPERRNADRLRSTELVEPQQSIADMNSFIITTSPGLERKERNSIFRITIPRSTEENILHPNKILTPRSATRSHQPNPENSPANIEQIRSEGHNSLNKEVPDIASNLARDSRVASSPRPITSLDVNEIPVNKRHSFNRLAGDVLPPNKRLKIEHPFHGNIPNEESVEKVDDVRDKRGDIMRSKRVQSGSDTESFVREPKRRRVLIEELPWDVMPTPELTLQAFLPTVEEFTRDTNNRHLSQNRSMQSSSGDDMVSILARLDQIEAENGPKRFSPSRKLQEIFSISATRTSEVKENKRLFHMGSTPVRNRRQMHKQQITKLRTIPIRAALNPDRLAEESVEKAKRLALRFQKRQFGRSPFSS